MLTYSFWHEGKPRVKERPRSGRTGRRLYTPRATRDAEASLAAAYDGPLFDVPLGMSIQLCRDGTLVTLWEVEGERHGLRGDVDNYAKLVMDALNGVAYTDDALVYEQRVSFGGVA